MPNEDFPTFPGPSLSLEEITAYLISLKSSGHNIYRDQKRETQFYISFDDVNRIRIILNPKNNTSQIQLLYCENTVDFVDVTSIEQVESTVAVFARKIPGSTWPTRPKTGRLSANTPATNFRTISQLIGTSNIETVFDPYLENSSLETLIHILSFGEANVSNGVRLLGSSKKSSGSIPRFTKVGVDAWLKQLKIKGEARIMSRTDEHRRFILLSGNKSLLLGLSLNAIDKNEAIRIESDIEDRKFFDKSWSQARALT